MLCDFGGGAIALNAAVRAHRPHRAGAFSYLRHKSKHRVQGKLVLLMMRCDIEWYIIPENMLERLHDKA
jgi:hypothetical protein